MVAKILLVLFVSSIEISDGFVRTQVGNHIIVNKIALFAKRGKNKKRNSSAVSGGGFGKVHQVKPPKEAGDFSVFPALEPQIQDSLIASVPELINEPGELPDEIYDRLDQIYGFPNFNYVSVEDSGVSFVDLISAPTTKVEPTMADDNFASLLSTPTGEINSTPSARFSSEGSSIDAISKLEQFSKMRVLHIDPLVIAVDDFFTHEECDRYIAMSTGPSKNKDDSPFKTSSMTVGKDSLAKAQRTSTTWFHHYKSAYELVAKASRLLGLKSIDQWEEPQTVRYRRTEKFTYHLDALSPAECADNLGGQRTATLLVYLTDLNKEDGGATIFRDLSADGEILKVRPQKGSALLFFPAAGGIKETPFDVRTLHQGEAVSETAEQDKWISQLWLRESTYHPTAPAGNNHADSAETIVRYCENMQV